MAILHWNKGCYVINIDMKMMHVFVVNIVVTKTMFRKRNLLICLKYVFIILYTASVNSKKQLQISLCFHVCYKKKKTGYLFS